MFLLSGGPPPDGVSVSRLPGVIPSESRRPSFAFDIVDNIRQSMAIFAKKVICADRIYRLSQGDLISRT